MGKPHKHRDLIRAWADGAQIQRKVFTDVWQDSFCPSWAYHAEYRIKPEPSDLEKYGVEVGDVWSSIRDDYHTVWRIYQDTKTYHTTEGVLFGNPILKELLFRRGVVNKL